MNTIWRLHNQNNSLARELSSALDISPITAQLLINRGHTDREPAGVFLDPAMSDLRDPDQFGMLEQAVNRVRSGLRNKEDILVYGDYDVDGLSATAVLLQFFQLVDREVDHYIPDRIDDGFGLSMDIVKRIHREQHPDVVITVDCGTSNKEEISYLNEHGVDVIVLDHHEPPEELPPAEAILNPKLDQGGYPFSGLCASGVAFKLTWGLARRFSGQRKVSEEFRGFLVDTMGLVALGTVADRVPLIDENRVFARYGMEVLPDSSNPGIRKLLERNDLQNGDVDASSIGYRLAPPLNAAGRLQESELGLQLFLADTEETAGDIADELDELNKKRRRMQRNVVTTATEHLDSDEQDGEEPVIVLSNDDWHPGIIGVAASRLVDRYGRPAILIGTGQEPAKGSARSVDGYPLHTALRSCSDLLIKHGGHSHAAGLTIEKDRIPELRRRLNQRAGDLFSGGEQGSGRIIDVDLEIFLPNLNWALLHEIKELEPHGEGNPEPIFASTGVELSSPPKLMGSSGNHISFRVSQGGVERRAVGFGMGDRMSKLDQLEGNDLALAYRPVINSWKGRHSIELHLEDFRATSEVQIKTRPRNKPETAAVST